MNRVEQQQWMERALDEVFRALASAPELNDVLIYKGARILRVHHPRHRRRTLDIDANLTSTFIASHPARNDQRISIERAVADALRRYFGRQPVVQLDVANVKAEHRPRDRHPHGWDGFHLHIALRDGTRSAATMLPRLSLDVAAPEPLTERSVMPLRVHDATVTVYSLHRLTAEKLRAYLERLPSHQAKIGASSAMLRVKDLYDIATVVESRPIDDEQFWHDVAREFVVACEALRAVVSRLEAHRAVPARFPLSHGTGDVR